MPATRKKNSGAAPKGGGKKRTTGKPARAVVETKEIVATAMAQEQMNADIGMSAARKGGARRRTARTPTSAAAEAKAKLATAVDPEEVSGDTGDSGGDGTDQVHSKAESSETLVEVCLRVPQFRSRVISHLLRKLR